MCTLIKELDFYFILSLFHKFVPLLSKYFLFKNCNTYQIKQTYDSLFRCGCSKNKLRTRIEQSKWLFFYKYENSIFSRICYLHMHASI